MAGFSCRQIYSEFITVGTQPFSPFKSVFQIDLILLLGFLVSDLIVELRVKWVLEKQYLSQQIVKIFFFWENIYSDLVQILEKVAMNSRQRENVNRLSDF